MQSLAKVTKRVTNEKSKQFFVIPKTALVIPYPYNYLVSYPLSLKLFCQLSLIPKTPNRASDSDAVWKHECCQATTMRRFNSPNRMVNSENFSRFGIFLTLCSLNIIFSYLGWLMSA